MIDGESTPTPADAPQAPEAPPAGSVRASLRAQHQEIIEDTDPLFLADPVHSGVVFRYHYVPLRNTTQASKRISKLRDPAAQTLASAIETILLSIDEIMVLDPNGTIPKGVGGRELYPQPLSPLADPGQPPIRFDEQLCEVMGFPADTAKLAANIVRQWFGPRGEYLIIEHAQEVSAWFTDVTGDVREEFGDSLGKA
jgi:hypothetical protein